MSPTDKTSRDIRQTPKQKEALRLSHQVGRGLGHGDTTTLAEAFCELWDELDIAYACAESSLAPCGHDERYCYTEDGGKNITCLLCEYKARSADRAQVEFRTADLPCKEPKIVYDGREVETPSSASPYEALANRLANLLPFTTPVDQMPIPWDEDRRYSDTEIERLDANKRVMAMLPEILAALRGPSSAIRDSDVLALIDEVEAMRRGVGVTHGSDPLPRLKAAFGGGRYGKA